MLHAITQIGRKSDEIFLCAGFTSLVLPVTFSGGTERHAIIGFEELAAVD